MHSLWFQKPHWRNIYRPFPKLPIKLVKMLGGRQSPEESRAKFHDYSPEENLRPLRTELLHKRVG
jgi:hypothetical protein